MSTVASEKGLHWKKRADEAWIAQGLGGVYQITESRAGGFRVWWIQTGAEDQSVDLGSYDVLGSAMAAAGRFDPSRGEMAAEPSHIPTSGEPAFESEETMRSKPIVIRKVAARGWQIYVRGEPVVAVTGKDGKQSLSFKGRPGYVEGSPIHTFKTKDLANSTAHHIGRYMLKLGDMVYTYVDYEDDTTETGTGVEETKAGECSCAHTHPASVPAGPCPQHGATPLAAEETATVAYEESRGRENPISEKLVRLRWHRTEDGEGYGAKGRLGHYTLKYRKPDRRHGVLRVALLLDGAVLTVDGFDTKTAAQAYAQTYDDIAPNVIQRHAPRSSGGCGVARIEADPAKAEACRLAAARVGPIDGLPELYVILHEEMSKHMQEVFVVIPLDVQNQLKTLPVEIARGELSRVSVDPALVIQAVALSGAERYWTAHCHPSGRAKPSQSDRDLTVALKKSAHAAFGGMPGVKPTREFCGHVVYGAGEIADCKTGRVLKIKK